MSNQSANNVYRVYNSRESGLERQNINERSRKDSFQLQLKIWVKKVKAIARRRKLAIAL